MMKTKHLALFFVTLLTSAALFAETYVAGPKGGRLLDAEPHKAEFFVTEDRKVEITFYDAGLKPVQRGSQVATVTAETQSGKTRVGLEATANGFVSRDPLPPGEPYRVVVQTRASTEAKPKNFRIDLNLENCAECNHPEYACTCEGH